MVCKYARLSINDFYFHFNAETISVEFYVRNTLQVPLLLSDVQILWKYSFNGWKRKTSISTENSEEWKEHTNDTLTEQVRIRQQ